MKEESRTKLSIKNVSFSLITQILTIFLNYICRFIFVKTLSEEYLGVNGLFTNILTIFSLAELGIGSAIIYAMYKPIADNDEEKIRKYMNFYKKCYNIIALVILSVGLIIIPNLKFFINEGAVIEHLNLIYVLYLLDSVFSYLFVYKSSILNAMQKNYICNYYQIIGKIIMTILMSISLIIFRNFIVYLTIQIAFKLIINILISIKADKLYPYIKNTKGYNLEKKDSRQIFKNVYALFCNQVGTVIINGTDNIIISKYVNLIAVGLYSNYCLVINALSNFIGQIFNAIVASVGNLAVKEEASKTYDLFKKVHFIDFIISSFCVVMTSSCINTFIQLSFGKKYLLDNFTVVIIMINFYLLSMKNVIGTFKYALGIFWNDKYSTIIRAIINLVLSIIFVKQYGIVGVFLGTLISDLLTTFWYQPYILYKKGFKVSWKNYLVDFFKYTFVTCIIIILVLFIKKYITVSSLLLKLLLEILVAFIIYAAIIILIYKNSEYFSYLKNIGSQYTKKIFKSKIK